MKTPKWQPERIGSVDLGEDNVFESGVVLIGPMTVGNENYFGHNSIVGGASRLTRRSGRTGAGVSIGSRNYLGDFSTVHTGLESATRMGSGCSIGAHAHVAHDVVLGDEVTISVGAVVGGHCSALSWSGLGIGAHIHPRTVVGPWSFVGMSSAVLTNVPPAMVIAGNPARLLRINFEALHRSGLSELELTDIRNYLDAGSPASTRRIREAIDNYDAASRMTCRNRVRRSWSDVEACEL